MEFNKKSPCNNCPYRKDAPLQYWDKVEFERLLQMGKDYMGAVYGCHKKDDNVCVGWLMDQDERNCPSIALRIALTKKNITRAYLDTLSCKSERFTSVEEMVAANFPELLNNE